MEKYSIDSDFFCFEKKSLNLSKVIDSFIEPIFIIIKHFGEINK